MFCRRPWMLRVSDERTRPPTRCYGASILKALAAFVIGVGTFTGSVSAQGRQNNSNGLFPVSQNDRNGYIDRAGEIAIPSKFDGGRKFSEGLAPVKVGDKWGFIDETGRVVVEPQFSGAHDFSEGLARVRVGGDKYAGVGWLYFTYADENTGRQHARL